MQLPKTCVISCMKAYADEPFVHILPEGISPSHAFQVRGTNDCMIGVFADRTEGQAIIVSVIDNLVKGASGQAVQNMNANVRLAGDHRACTNDGIVPVKRIAWCHPRLPSCSPAWRFADCAGRNRARCIDWRQCYPESDNKQIHFRLVRHFRQRRTPYLKGIETAKPNEKLFAAFLVSA